MRTYIVNATIRATGVEETRIVKAHDWDEAIAIFEHVLGRAICINADIYNITNANRYSPNARIKAIVRRSNELWQL